MTPDPQALWNDQKEYKESLHLTIGLMSDMMSLILQARELNLEVPSAVSKALEAMTLELGMDSLAYSNATSNADAASLSFEESSN